MIENTEYAAMMQRMVRSWAKRVSEGDPADFAEMVKTAELLDELLVDACASMRSRHGFSWAQVGREVGMSKQGAQQRWGRRPGRAQPGTNPGAATSTVA